MVELLFDKSAAGSLGIAKHKNAKSDTILYLNVDADMGDISCLSDFDTRREHYNQMGMSELQEDGWLDKHISDLKSSYAALLRAAADGQHTRIWWSGAPGEMCRQYWILNEVRSPPWRLSGIKVPHLQSHTADP